MSALLSPCQLLDLKQKIRDKRKLESALSEALRQQNEALEARDLYQDLVQREWKDVEVLESSKLISVLFTIWGNKDEKLKKEQQEYLSAKLKYDQSLYSLTEIEITIAQIKSQLDCFKGVENDHQLLIEEIRTQLLKGGSEGGEKLIEIENKHLTLKADQKEIEEAIRAGSEVTRTLRTALNQLGSAKNWGTFDMLGGGLIATYVKHSKIDSANDLIRVAQNQLRLFQRELADAEQRLNLSVELGDFSTFADYYFDGLIADWIVQSKINRSAETCGNVLSKVEKALAACRNQLWLLDKESEKLSETRKQTIEGIP